MSFNASNPFPFSKYENDFTLGSFRSQQRQKYKNSTCLAQRQEPWNRLYHAATLASTIKGTMSSGSQVSADSLDFHLKSVYDHHKDLLWSKTQVVCQEETTSEHRKNVEKQEEQENESRMWVDPKRSSIHKVN